MTSDEFIEEHGWTVRVALETYIEEMRATAQGIEESNPVPASALYAAASKAQRASDALADLMDGEDE